MKRNLVLSLFLIVAVIIGQAQAEIARKPAQECTRTSGEIQNLKNKAGAGDGAAAILLATEYISGLCMPEDSMAARRILEKEAYADSGNLVALHRLAATYSGWGNAPKDEAKARELYLQAADAGYAPAEYDVAGFQLNGSVGFRKNFVQAIEWYQKAADHGFPDAARDLASIYRLGIQTKKDDVQAERWLRCWAETGDSIALTELGGFLVGRGTKESTSEAVNILEQAAKKGMYSAGGALGALFETSPFLTKSPYHAYVWYSIAEAGGLVLRERLGAVKSQLSDKDIESAQKEINSFTMRYTLKNMPEE
jgi:TPR repeat protein